MSSKSYSMRIQSEKHTQFMEFAKENGYESMADFLIKAGDCLIAGANSAQTTAELLRIQADKLDAMDEEA